MEGRHRRASRVVGLEPGDRKHRHNLRETASVLSVGSSMGTGDGSSARVSRNSRQHKLSRASGRMVAKTEVVEEKKKPPEMAVMHFVYSEAVEKAIRRGYKTSALPPLTGAHFRRENTYMVNGVPDIFSELVTTRRIRKRNVMREREYRSSLPDLKELAEPVAATGLSRMRLKLAAASGVLDRMRKLGGGQTLGGAAGLGVTTGNKLPSLLLTRARQLQNVEATTAAVLKTGKDP